MSDNVEVPVTIVEKQVQVPITPDSPAIFREVLTEPSTKISAMVRALAADLAASDLVIVARPNVSTKATTIAALAAFLTEVAMGPALLLEEAESTATKMSQLAALVGQVNPEAVAPLVQEGENYKLSMQQLAGYIQSARGAYTRTPVGLSYANTNAAGNANTAIIQALADEMSPDNGGTGGIIYFTGEIRLGAVRLHPAVHVWGSGRFGGKIKAIDNVPYTVGTRRVNGVVTPDANGEERAVFYCLARAPYVLGQGTPTQATQAWVPQFHNLTIDGNKGNQSGNWVAGIYAEHGASDPHFDDVAPGGNAKAYTGLWTFNVEVHDCSGTGIYNGPERQRAYFHGTRSLGNGTLNAGGTAVATTANGFKIMGNDSIIGPRCGSGGNTDTAVEFSGCSGVSVTQGNFWNGNVVASNAATVFMAFGCNGVALHGNVFNGNVFCSSGSNVGNRRKPCVIVGNESRIADELFPEGQPDGTPLGLLNPERNAFYTIAGYQQFICEANGVAMAGNDKRFKKLLWAVASGGGGPVARGTAKFTVSTDPAYKPFFDPIGDAIGVEAGGNVMWDITDTYMGRRYQNGVSVVAGAGGMLSVDGALGLKQVVQTMVEATALTLDGAAGICKLQAGAALNALPLRLPMPKADNHFLLVQFGQHVEALTPQITPGQQDAPTDGGALQNVLIDLGNRPAPFRVKSGDTLAWVYKKSTTTWQLIGLWGGSDPFQYKVRTTDPMSYVRNLTSTYLPHSGNSPVGAGKEVAFDSGLYTTNEPLVVGIANSLTSPAMGTAVIQGTFSATATQETGVVSIDTTRLQQDDISGRGVIRNLEIRGDAHTTPFLVTAKVHGIFAGDGPGEGNMHTMEFPRASRVTGSGLYVRGRDQLIMFRAKFSDARDWAIDAEDMGDSKWWGIGAKAGSGDPRCDTNPEFKSTGGAVRIAHCATFSVIQFDFFVDDETFGGKCVVLLEDQTNARFAFGEISGPCFIQGRNYQNGGNEYEINNNSFLNVLFKRAHGLPRVWTYDRPKGPSPITLSCYVFIEDADGPMFNMTKYGGIDPDNPTEMANRYDYLWQFSSQEGANHTNMGFIHVLGHSGLFLRLSRVGDPKGQEVPFLVHCTNKPKRVHFVGFTPGELEDIPWDDANPPLTHVKAGVYGSGVPAVYQKNDYKWGYLLATWHNPTPGTLTDGVATFSVRPAPTILPPGRAWAQRVVPW